MTPTQHPEDHLYIYTSGRIQALLARYDVHWENVRRREFKVTYGNRTIYFESCGYGVFDGYCKYKIHICHKEAAYSLLYFLGANVLGENAR